MLKTKDACLLATGIHENASAFQHHAQHQDGEYLLLFFDTKGTITLNQQKYQVQPFMFLIFQFEQQELSITCTEDVTFRWMHLRFSENCMNEMQERGLNTGKLYIVAQPLAIAEMYKILQQNIISVSEDMDSFSNEIRFYALRLMLCLLIQDTDSSAVKAVKIPHYEKLAALRREIYLHPSESWKIQDICKKLCISRPYFHKIYLSAFDTTCTQDVIKARITLSKRLLKNSDDAISAISQQCGFETDVYFMRQFKRHVGMTPTAFRRICRQNPGNDKTMDF